MRLALVQAGNNALAARLTDLVNRVYAVGEEGLWRNGATRTTIAEVTAMIGAGEIAIATVGDQLAGAVRVQVLPGEKGEFGMLAADFAFRGSGVGSALVEFSEQLSRERGLPIMQLELLVPREWRHPSKVFLDGWYRRIGYRVVSSTSVEDLHPQLAPMLATPCRFDVYEKSLTPA
jgi:GNAT superfamily N-acetyltransferase